MLVKQGKKFERTTSEQIQFYISFCRAHPEMQGGKFNSTKPNILTNLWKELAENLNAMRGPTRTAVKWKESLTQWKSQMRCRARKEKWKNKWTDNNSVNKPSIDIEKETLQSIEILADDQEEFLHHGPQENSMSATPSFSELSKAILEDDQEVLPQLGLQKKFQIISSAEGGAASTETKFDPLNTTRVANSRSPIFGTESNTSSTESTAPTFTFLNAKNKKRKKISPEAMMKQALESLKRREDRELKMWEEMRLQQKQTTQMLERLGDNLINITAVLEKLVNKKS